MKIIGYGICGPGEAKRYMRQTLEEFARLCDEVIILCNNCDAAEIELINEFGFQYVQDRREWGFHQWRIKQDFMQRDIKRIAEKGDVLVCLDMDEVFDKQLTKEWLMEMPFDAYHVFVVDLWNDPEHFKLESCFWNVRIWRWGAGDTKFKAKPVHCGLAPEWTYLYHRHAPFLLKHFGLMLKEDRERKIARYQKYDPQAQYLDQKYYDMLKDDKARPFDEDALHEQIAEEVATYKQTKPKENMASKPKPRFAYVKNPHGEVVDIPERHVEKTLKRPGFTFVGWADEEQDEIEEMFEDTELDAEDGTQDLPPAPDPSAGAYQRSAADEKRELDERNAADDVKLSGSEEKEMFEDPAAPADQTPPAAPVPPADSHPKPDPNKPKEEKVDTPPAAPAGKKTEAKGKGKGGKKK